MTINGEAVGADSTFDVEDPATEEVCGQAPDCSVGQLDAAVMAAVRAYPAWRRDRDIRMNGLLAMASALEVQAERLAWLLTMEQGKPLSESRREMALASERLRHYAAIESEETVIRDDGMALVEVVRKPIGVVAVITPWNSPIITAINRVAPSLWAGNTVVLKPSPYTPLSTLETGRLLACHLPPGVLNVISGNAASLGEALVQHPEVGKVAFTGSVSVGRQIAESAGRHLRPAALELGGNDPAIILEDVDVPEIAKRIFWTAFTNCGQICVAVKRLYVPSALYDQMVASLGYEAERAIVGDGKHPETQIGPLSNKSQLARVCELVDDALDRGGVAVAGGGRINGSGHFFQPTILRNVTDGIRVVDEEQFGPVLPVIKYDDIDDAVERANRTHFGLGASVWGRDAGRAREIGERLECGMVWINNHRALGASQPFGGIKESGVVGPTFGVDEFTLPQVVWCNKGN